MMIRTRYQRTVAELHEMASMFWPAELSEEAAKLSVVPYSPENTGRIHCDSQCSSS